jgi:uncharacterized protein YjbI with pentapeptide repeats
MSINFEKDPESFEHFLNLPFEMQSKIISDLSEKEVYNLVLLNPKAVLNQANVDILKKYYTYVINQGVYQALKQKTNKIRAFSKVTEYASSFFVKDIGSVKPLFKEGGEFLLRLNLKGFSTKELDSIIDYLPNPLEQLRSINLKESKINANQLSKLLSLCPNLKNLNLSTCLQLKAFDFKGLVITSLEEVTLSGTKITPEDLNKVLQLFPNLKKINLSSCTQLKALDFKGLVMPSLEEVTLSRTKITSTDLNKVLKLCPSLKKIELNYCPELKDFDFSSMQPMLFLKEIELSNTNIATTDLDKILRFFPSLQKLNLNACEQLTDITFDLQPFVSSIEEINFSNSVINNEDLKSVLEHTPNLKALNLSFCLNLSEVAEFESVTLKDLKKIDFSHSNINKMSLENILKCAPNLEILDLAFQHERDLKFENIKPIESLKEIRIDAKHSEQDRLEIKKSFPNADIQISNK